MEQKLAANLLVSLMSDVASVFQVPTEVAKYFFIKREEELRSIIISEIKDGDFKQLLEELMQKPVEEMKELYNNREIEK